MFTYKNKNTGVVITTHGQVTGENWELVKPKKGGKESEKKPKQDEAGQEEDDEE